MLFLNSNITYGQNTPVNISGVIMAPPACVINGDQVIDVDFGNNVNTRLIDGKNYLKQVSYTVSCTNRPSNSMRLKITGTTADFNINALKTNNSDLAISMLADGVVFNGWKNFTYPIIPKLEAVLIKRAGSTLQAGAFYAIATLVVEYQ